jgi:glycoside/pentoside/hexuronide:cation symporter, GPH family
MATEAPTATAEADKIPLGTKIVYGVGAANDMWGNWLYPGLANPVYNIYLGLAPWMLGLTAGLQRAVDCITDPFIGWLSDNTRSRWGRRRPWILFGGVAAGLGLPLLFMVGEHWSLWAKFTYMLVSAVLYMPVVAAYNMPYQSLGSELTPDYHERTRLMGIKNIIQKLTEVAFFVAVPFTTLSWFRMADAVDPATGAVIERYNTLEGARYYCTILGALMIVVSLLNFFFLKERYYEKLVTKQAEKISLKHALVDAFACSPFRRLLLLNLVGNLGSGMVGTLGFYATVYYVCGGNLKTGGHWNMLMGFAYSCSALVSVPAVSALAKRTSKRIAILGTLMFAILAFVGTWWLYNPRFPWLQLLASGTIAMAGAAMNTLTGSMIADTIDYSEITTHKRSEGSFTACFAWVVKLGLAVAAVGAGAVLSLTGFDSALVTQTPHAIFNIRLYLAAVPIVGYAIAMIVALGYPLSPEKMAEVRGELEARRGKV